LHAIFQDWHVALTAYNIGERRMMNVISDASHNDVFKLAEQGVLGAEGGRYLSKVIAAMIIFNKPDIVQ
jgi:membrane-bound lytic murein transglycosylase D